MTPEQAKHYLHLQERQAIALETIAQLLKQSLPRPPAPNYEATLENFPTYDWQAIGAKVELTDNYGVASVIWNGERYSRRSPNNSYGAVIFFSRCVGKSAEGKNLYERLITFKPLKDLEVEPISRKAEQIIK
ncbi:MAG: single-stranded DNA-binding protein [Cyanobacteria bacterium P01_G01_bin.19]